MRQIETMKASEAIASAIFDDFISPLAIELREKREASFFPMGPESALQTYFTVPASRDLAVADMTIEGGGSPDGIIDALVQYWRATGNDELAALGPYLKEIANALEAEDDAASREVNPLCYTLF